MSHECETVSDEELVNALCIWQMKGHNPLHQIRFFGKPGEPMIFSVPRYSNPDVLLINGKEYKNNAGALSAIGSLLDRLERD